MARKSIRAGICVQPHGIFEESGAILLLPWIQNDDCHNENIADTPTREDALGESLRDKRQGRSERKGGCTLIVGGFRYPRG